MIPPNGDPPTSEDDAADAAPSEALEAELGALEALLPERRPPDRPAPAVSDEAEEEGRDNAPT